MSMKSFKNYNHSQVTFVTNDTDAWLFLQPKQQIHVHVNGDAHKNGKYSNDFEI